MKTVHFVIALIFVLCIISNNPITARGQILILSPLLQFKQGTPAQDIKCNTNLRLVLKAEDESPACVNPKDIVSLVQRGWALNYTEMADKEFVSLSAFQGESWNAWYRNGTAVSNFTIEVNINNFKPSNASLNLEIYYNDGALYKTVNVRSDMMPSDGFYKYPLTAISDKDHPPPFKVVAIYNNKTAIAYAPVFLPP